jgi:hypothetical protein
MKVAQVSRREMEEEKPEPWRRASRPTTEHEDDEGEVSHDEGVSENAIGHDALIAIAPRRRCKRRMLALPLEELDRSLSDSSRSQ